MSTMETDERIIKMTCRKCGRSLQHREFFKMRDGTRFPICMVCLTAHIDNYKPDTFLWILKKFDIPYVESTWRDLTNKAYMKNPAKFSGKSVLGTYMRTMNMTQWAGKKWADSDELNDRLRPEDTREEFFREHENYEEDLLDKLASGAITQSEYDTMTMTNAEHLQPFVPPGTEDLLMEFDDNVNNPRAPDDIQVNAAQSPVVSESDIMSQLSEDEYQYLILKWGYLYKPSQLVRMERTYKEYADEYELNADREEALKKICKASLKMDEALDCGNAVDAQKFSNINDQLRKSAKFTEAQNKEQMDREIDSIGQLVAFVEREGGVIPNRYDPLEYPEDKIDFTIRDMKNYVNTLVREELGLGDLIETFIEKTEKQKVQTVEDIILDSMKTPEEREAEAQSNEMEDYISFQDFYQQQIEEESRKLAEEFGEGLYNESERSD